MALYKDTQRCQKCKERFVWYYQPAAESDYARRISVSGQKSAEVSGMMLLTENIYAVQVVCPYCGERNEFNCKIEQELPGLGHRE